MERLKRWGKGALAVALAWLGGFNELPYTAPEPESENSDDPEEGE